MKDLRQFNIPFLGLEQGSHLFKYQINNLFFEIFKFHDFFDSNINVTLNLLKNSTVLKFVFKADGVVTVPCDVTNERFNQKIKATLPLIVKFGLEFDDNNEEILILPYEQHQLNVAQYIYEMIVLAVPLKRVHPKVLDGTMDSEVLRTVEKLTINKTSTQQKVVKQDPRWDKLKQLLTQKKG